MKKEKKTKPYVEPYFEEMHRKGITLTIISLILFVGVPTITCIVYDIMPNFGTVIATGIGLIAIFVPTGIAEMFGEVPIMGSSYYLACLTGNILNLKLPSAINAIKVSGFKQGTKEADVVVGIAIAVSDHSGNSGARRYLADAVGIIHDFRSDWHRGFQCASGAVWLSGAWLYRQRCRRRHHH